MSAHPLLWESCVCYQEGRTDSQIFEGAIAPFVPCFPVSLLALASLQSEKPSHSPFSAAGFDGHDTVGAGGT